MGKAGTGLQLTGMLPELLWRSAKAFWKRAHCPGNEVQKGFIHDSNREKCSKKKRHRNSKIKF